MAKPRVTSTDINSTYPDLLTKSYLSSSGGLTIDTTSYNEYQEFIDYVMYGKSEGAKAKEPKDSFTEKLSEDLRDPRLAMKDRVKRLVKGIKVNGPAIIVFWKDNTKTVVKCENEEFDLEKGLAMALLKRIFRNKGNYNAFLDVMTQIAEGGK